MWVTFVVAIFCTLATASSALAEKRIALVIGNSAYKAVTALPNATNDASLVAQALKTIGISDVTMALDQNRADLSRTLRDFAAKADNADWAIIYYAGHGIEVDGKNYLIPTDAALARDRDVPFETIGLNEVVSTVENTRSISIIFLDACRNNPFEARMKTRGVARSVNRGLSRVEPTGAVAVVYAAKEGTVAADGEGLNSPFADAVATEIIKPGIEINMTFRRIRQKVLEATDREQEPFVYGSLPPTEFYFAPLNASAKDNSSNQNINPDIDQIDTLYTIQKRRDPPLRKYQFTRIEWENIEKIEARIETKDFRILNGDKNSEYLTYIRNRVPDLWGFEIEIASLKDSMGKQTSILNIQVKDIHREKIVCGSLKKSGLGACTGPKMKVYSTRLPVSKTIPEAQERGQKMIDNISGVKFEDLNYGYGKGWTSLSLHVKTHDEAIKLCARLMEIGEKSCEVQLIEFPRYKG